MTPDSLGGGNDFTMRGALPNNVCYQITNLNLEFYR